MNVVPFDPSRRRARRDRGHDGDPPEPTALEDAQARVALLERALIATLRENAQNWARAERAEGHLATLTGAPETSAP